MRDWLLNRYSITLAIIAVATVLWNAYVALHDHGVELRLVVDAGGRPVVGVKVVLRERTLVTAEPRGETTTDADGRFRFTGLRYHHMFVDAERPGSATVRRDVKLYFQGQDRTLEEPLRLTAKAGS